MAWDIFYSFLLILSSQLLFAPFSLSTSSASAASAALSGSPLTLISFCKSTPYPDSCLNSLKLSLPITTTITPTVLNFVFHSLNSALSEGHKLSRLLTAAGSANFLEKQRGTIQDCRELHEITLSCLKRSLTRVTASLSSKQLSDSKTFLSAALTNKITCLEGLESGSGSLKPALLSSLSNTYAYVSNSLSMLPATPRGKSGAGGGGNNRRRLLGFPRWLSKKARRILASSSDEYGPTNVMVVAADGNGNFSTVSDAVNFAPNNSVYRVIIYVKAGVYEENVEIPSWKTNIVLIGDGSDVTVIRGGRSVADGWTTFRSATVAVSGEGFLARDIMFENTAGPEKHQAVALRINADLAAVYRCIVNGFQDSLYVHSFRQFYRECDIYGTIDYIFGNSAAVFQACNIISRMPLPGQFTVITAQSRESEYENTGISLQNCSILATEELFANRKDVKSYLGRPWKNRSRTVLLSSYIDEFVAPEGWTVWNGDEGLATLYYGEYENYGPGSDTGGRVSWEGYRVMTYSEASSFTVSELIAGDQWLGSTSFPYDEGI